jgi:2-polyprenyl-3-methyl-5-hydroxy-6-metoxy-1,4-benzoquinol methylase
MGFNVSKGVEDAGVVVGNAYDKYGSRNPVVRYLMHGFEEALTALVELAAPESVHEIGCGEGYWVLQWAQKGLRVRGCDFSAKVIEIAQQNARQLSLSESLFGVRSIYDIAPDADSADLLVCCEVLEHLEDPRAGLAALQRVATKHIILSVPREPLWCALNMARGKYWSAMGNTPGHLQHWSRREFVTLVSQYFDVIEVRTPLPWTMLLAKVKE